MLDQQDIEVIKTIVKDETSDIRQDVSILKQDVSLIKLKQEQFEVNLQKLDDKVQRQGVVLEDQTSLLQLIYENTSTFNQKADQIPDHKNQLKNHEVRITSLEKVQTKLATAKRKTA